MHNILTWRCSALGTRWDHERCNINARMSFSFKFLEQAIGKITSDMTSNSFHTSALSLPQLLFIILNQWFSELLLVPPHTLPVMKSRPELSVLFYTYQRAWNAVWLKREEREFSKHNDELGLRAIRSRNKFKVWSLFGSRARRLWVHSLSLKSYQIISYWFELW